MSIQATYDSAQTRRGYSFSDSEGEDTALDFPYQYQEDKNIGKCLLTLFTWATFGLIFTLPGPTLLGISCYVCTEIDKIGVLFVGRGLGALIGALAARSLIYRVKGYGVLMLSLVILIVSISVFPVIKELGTAAGIMVIVGFAYGASMEGYVIMDDSSGLHAKDSLSKKTLAFSVGAATAPFLSVPFIDNLISFESQNRTGHGDPKNASANGGAFQVEGVCHIFPGDACLPTNHFAKAMWLSVIPCCVLMLFLCAMIVRKSEHLVVNQPTNTGIKRPADFKVYALRFVSFGVMFFYQGSFIVTAIVVFTYVMLGPFNAGKTKAALFVSMLWVAFSFGLLMLQLLLKKITRPEKRLGTAVFKASICFISAICLMKIESSNGQTLILFVYMFFIANLNTTVQDVLVSQAVFSKQLLNTMQLFAAALAEIVFPYFSLALMYHKGWHAMSFAILFVSLMLFLSCTMLALCPATLHKDLVSLHYQNLTETVEDGNGRRIRKQIKSLLGGYTDQDTVFEASEEEVLFDKKRNSVR